MSRVGGKIRVGRVTPIQQFFFFGLMAHSLPQKDVPISKIEPLLEFQKKKKLQF